MLVNIWEDLIANYSNVDLAEGYLYRKPVRRRAGMITRSRQEKRHNFVRLSRRY
jgi:hypothetical protein